MLKHLHHITKCPTCGAPVFMASVSIDRASKEPTLRTHTNGQQFESVSAACGWGVDHVPNFSRAIVRRECPNEPERLAKVQRQADLQAKLIRYVKREAAREGMNPDAAVAVFLHGIPCVATEYEGSLWRKQ